MRDGIAVTYQVSFTLTTTKTCFFSIIAIGRACAK
jgi:hypothetical protein